MLQHPAGVVGYHPSWQSGSSRTYTTHACSKCRCIKPNPESQPGSLTPNYVLEQLRAGGVLEAVRIACAGFPTRKPFRPFAIRYNILLASGKGAYRHLDPETLRDEEAADISRKVLQAVKIIGWQMGKTRVFLRAGQLAQLEVVLSHTTQAQTG